MKKIILIAVNKGGVIVGRKIVDFIDDVVFETQKKDFASQHVGYFTFFMTFPELKSMMELMDKN